jgi:hypothetical protein
MAGWSVAGAVTAVPCASAVPDNIAKNRHSSAPSQIGQRILRMGDASVTFQMFQT